MARILHIEDDPLAAAVVGDLLLEAGHTYRHEIRGGSALPAIRAARPELVLVDLSLPDVSGFDIVRAIRSSSGLHLLPVMVLTAFQDQDTYDTAMSLGANAVVTKACRDNDFVTAIECVFNANNLRRKSGR